MSVDSNAFLCIFALIVMVIIFLNELRHISTFIIKYNFINDVASINTKQNCQNIYCEAETPRFQLAKNMYNLLLPNDLFNAKSYTILILIYAIMFFIIAFYNFIYLLNQIEFIIIDLFIIIIILYLLVFFILYIGLRYVPTDEQGYLNYYLTDFENYTQQSQGFNFTLFNALIFIMIIYYLINFEKIKKHFLQLALISLYFIFSLYIINIVGAFKENIEPSYQDANGDIHNPEFKKNFTADISHASEDYFCHNYMYLTTIPSSIFYDRLQANSLKYKIPQIYMFKYILEYGVPLFVCISVFLLVYLIMYLFNKEKKFSMEKVLIYIAPIIILFVLMLFIFNFTTYNTAFNKYVLYGATSSVYKRKLNSVNNIVTPFIKMHEYKQDPIRQKSYLYHYIVINVLISYLTKYINADNTFSTLNKLNNFEDIQYMNNNGTKFKQILDNDINDIEKFKAYYEELFRLVLNYNGNEIPTNLDKSNINSNYISLLDKIFSIEDDSKKFKFESINDICIIPTTDKATAYKTNIYNSVAYCIHILDKYNNNKEELSNMYFYIENDNTCYIYKFLLKGGDHIKPPTYAQTYKTQIDNIIDYFLNNLRILYYDYDGIKKLPTGTTDQAYTENFYSIMYNTLKSFVDTKIENDYQFKLNISQNNTCEYTLHYLYHKMISTLEVFNKEGNNDLKNKIRNMYYQINDKKTEINLYKAGEKNATFEKNDTEPETRYKINGLENSSANDENIIKLANQQIKENFVFTYVVNIIIIFSMYTLILKSFSN
jgi:hypothetical protein